MICPTCLGEGSIWVESIPVTGVMPGDPDRPPPGASLKQPCPTCMGSGIASCCDGMVELETNDA